MLLLPHSSMFFCNEIVRNVFVLIVKDFGQNDLISSAYPTQSRTPLNCASPSAFLMDCNLVLITSNGFTDRAANEPAAQPENYNFH